MQDRADRRRSRCAGRRDEDAPNRCGLVATRHTAPGFYDHAPRPRQTIRCPGKKPMMAQSIPFLPFMAIAPMTDAADGTTPAATSHVPTTSDYAMTQAISSAVAAAPDDMRARILLSALAVVCHPARRPLPDRSAQRRRAGKCMCPRLTGGAGLAEQQMRPAVPEHFVAHGFRHTLEQGLSASIGQGFEPRSLSPPRPVFRPLFFRRQP